MVGVADVGRLHLISLQVLHVILLVKFLHFDGGVFTHRHTAFKAFVL